MKILTITCHDVYNFGASLQAYALQHYLEELGHEVEIINYRPGYLYKKYDWKSFTSKKFDKLNSFFVTRWMFRIAKWSYLRFSLGRKYGAQNETYIEGWEKKTSNLLIYKRLCNV